MVGTFWRPFTWVWRQVTEMAQSLGRACKWIWRLVTFDSGEPRDLERLIVARRFPVPPDPTPSDQDPPNPTPDQLRFQTFVKYRFTRPLRTFAWRGPWYGRAFTWLSISAIVAGVLSSSIAAKSSDNPSEAAQRTLIALGLIVAGVTAINQVWKPGQRSVSSH